MEGVEHHALGAQVRRGPALVVMPSPQTLRAPAVWVTARNWAQALEDRFGEVLVCLPHATTLGADSLEPYTRPQKPQRPRASPSHRRRRVRHERVLAHDLLLARRRLRDARSYDLGTARPPIVWQHHDLLLRAGASMAELSSAPLVHFVDALQVWEARRWGVTRPGWGAALERWAEIPQLRVADAIACVSDDVAEAVVAASPRSASKIVVTPCTADPRRFSPDVDGSRVRTSAGIGEADLLFGWVGSFRRFHEVGAAVEAFSRVLRDLPHAKLLLIGDGDTRSSVQKQVVELGLCDRVLLPGAVPHELVPEHVAAFDVALVTAGSVEDFHYSPLKLREYLVSGKAVVAPRAGQIATDLQDGVHALLYDVGDTASLARAMGRLGRDAVLRCQLADCGRSRELEVNSIDAQLDRVLALAEAHAGRRS